MKCLRPEISQCCKWLFHKNLKRKSCTSSKLNASFQKLNKSCNISYTCCPLKQGGAHWYNIPGISDVYGNRWALSFSSVHLIWGHLWQGSVLYPDKVAVTFASTNTVIMPSPFSSSWCKWFCCLGKTAKNLGKTIRDSGECLGGDVSLPQLKKNIIPHPSQAVSPFIDHTPPSVPTA